MNLVEKRVSINIEGSELVKTALDGANCPNLGCELANQVALYLLFISRANLSQFGPFGTIYKKEN